jgi:hypothetical protein
MDRDEQRDRRAPSEDRDGAAERDRVERLDSFESLITNRKSRIPGPESAILRP